MLAILYSNTPNPLVIERYAALEAIYPGRVGFIYVLRKDSPIRMPGSSDFRILSVIHGRRSESAWINKIYNIILMIRSLCAQKPKAIYAVYPDMLCAAVVYKCFSPSVKVFYEIQDLHNIGGGFRFLHNLLMTQAEKIFLTSRAFKEEFSDLFPGLTEKQLYISNCPDANYWNIQSEWQQRTLDHSSIGVLAFVGMLRDAEHLDHIRAILRHTNLSVLQAGVSVFEVELNALSSEYPGRLSLFGAYAQDDLYNVILPNTDAVWCVYPKTRNYIHHVARRYNECRMLGLRLIIANHAEEMVKLSKGVDTVLVLNNTEISEREAKEIAIWIKTDKPKFTGIDLKFSFQQYKKKFIDCFDF